MALWATAGELAPDMVGASSENLPLSGLKWRSASGGAFVNYVYDSTGGVKVGSGMTGGMNG